MASADAVSSAKALFQNVSAAPIPTGGFLRSGDGCSSKERASVFYSQLDFDYAPNGKLPGKRSYVRHGPQGFPTQLGGDFLAVRPNSDNDQMAIFRSPPSDSKDNPAGTLEVWSNCGHFKTIKLGKQCGPPIVDPWFGSMQWSPDGTKISFVAEPKEELQGHWDPPKEDANRKEPVDGDADAGCGLSNKWMQRQDWGESYTDEVRNPQIFVVTIASGEVKAVTMASECKSCGQARWLSDSELVYVCWELTEKLGIIYCHQRKSSLCKVTLDGTVTKLTQHPLDFSCRSPRLAPSGKEIIFLSRESVGAHFHACRLRSLDLSTLQVRTVVDVVDSAALDAFPGLYVSNLPNRCWVDQESIILSTGWRFDQAMVQINVASGALHRLDPPSSTQSVSVEDVDLSGNVLCIASSPVTIPMAYVYTIAQSSYEVVHSDVSTCPAAIVTKDAIKGIEWKLLSVPCDPEAPSDKDAGRVEVVTLRPSKDKPPLVLYVHGGPHGFFSTNFNAGALVLAARGYTVALVNYRGSAGYGEKALSSLPGNCGTQDVEDCMVALRAAAEATGSDLSRASVIGGSHGGFLSCHLTAQHNSVFKATVMRNPVTDLTTMIGCTDIEDWCMYEAGVGTREQQIEAAGGKGISIISEGLQEEDLIKLHKASPMRMAHGVSAASLILLGKDDRRVPPSQGRAWARALRSRTQAVTEILEYEDSAHPIAACWANADVWVNTILWLDRFS